MGKRSKFVVLIGLFIVFLVMVTLLGGGYFGYKYYIKQQQKFYGEISSLPVFDSVQSEKNSSKELKVAYPLLKTTKTIRQIKLEVSKGVKSEVALRFPASRLTKTIIDLMKKYSIAKVGDRVIFQTKKNNKLIEGIFKGNNSEGRRGNFILIEGIASRIDKYRLKDIIKEYTYIFDEGSSAYRQRVEVDKTKKAFNEIKTTFVKKVYDIIKEKIYKAANYTKNPDGEWVSVINEIERIVKVERDNHNDKAKIEINALEEKYKILGFIKIPISKELMDKFNSNSP